MADPQHIPVLDGFDRMTVALYRTGLSVAAVGVAVLAGLSAAGQGIGPALAVILGGTLLAALDMHLYDKRVRWVIAGSAMLGAFGIATGTLAGLPIGTLAGLGFVFVALSGFALKEQFCFRIPGLRLVPLFLAFGLLPLVFDSPRIAAGIYAVASLPMLVLCVAKWRMPLHFDIGDKSRYQI